MFSTICGSSLLDLKNNILTNFYYKVLFRAFYIIVLRFLFDPPSYMFHILRKLVICDIDFIDKEIGTKVGRA